MKKQNTRRLTLLAMFIVIEIILVVTPFGYIPLGFSKITTMHIPVIAASILLGYKEGMLLGFIFGITSVLHNTFFPVVTSFVFSPFYGNWYSIFIAIIPRVLLGIIPYFMMEILRKWRFASFLSAFVASFCHTFLVVIGIYLFFSDRFITQLHYNNQTLVKLLQTIITVNGILEAVLAGIVVGSIYRSIKVISRKD